MSLTASTAGPYFSSGSISFSQLRSNFKETASGSVSASELLRVTDLTNTNPTVPNATENANISTSTNLKASQFRNSIKYYNLNQGSGDTDLNLNIANSSLWNGNLGKNIVKTVTLAGTTGSSTANTPAASLDAASVYNVLLVITGSILGDGGAAGTASLNGGNGGDALYINTNSTGTVIVRTSGVSSQVYGGGGGGGYGGDGGNGGGGTYTTTSSYQQTLCGGGSGFHNSGGYSQACSSQNPDASSCNCVTPNYGFSGPTWACCNCCCTYNRTSTSTNYTSGGTGGVGGTAGLGQGYLQTRTFGGNGTAGGPGGSYAGNGGNGGNGGDGGDWGQNGQDAANGSNGANGNYTNGTSGTSGTLGGAAGRAVSGSGYTIDTINGVDSAYKGAK